MPKIKIEALTEATILNASFRRVSQKVRDARPAMTRASLLMLQSIRKNFIVGGRPFPWKEVKHRWGRKNRKGKAHTVIRPLLDTARLFNSIRVIKIGDDFFEVGTNVSYAKTHDEGAMVPKKVIPNAPVKAHRVKRYTRTNKETGKKVKVKSHKVRAHTRTVTIKAHKVPARPFLIVQKGDADAILVEYARGVEFD